MGLKEKLASVPNNDWVTEGLEKSEVKSIVELAKFRLAQKDVEQIYI